MSLHCAACQYDNDPTRVYCHNCGAKLERGAASAPPPTGYTHPTEVTKLMKKRPPFNGRAVLGAVVRLLVLAGVVWAVVLAFLPPHDLPPPVAPDQVVAERLSVLVADSSSADGTRAFAVPAGDASIWLASTVTPGAAQGGLSYLKPERVYLVPGRGDFRLGLETQVPLGLRIYFEGVYAPGPDASGTTLQARRLSIGRLPLPPVLDLLVRKQFESLRGALAVPLGQLATAKEITVSPDVINLRWSPRSP
ncbi:MAG: hypothetical protein ACOYOL_07620 [Chthoniobacterales bacterium]